MVAAGTRRLGDDRHGRGRGRFAEGLVWTAIGVALLADVQGWASDVVIWSSLAVLVGLACMIAATQGLARRDGRGRTGDPALHDGTAR